MIRRSQIILISAIILAEIIIISLIFISISLSQSNKYERAIEENSTNQPTKLINLGTSNDYIYTVSNYNSVQNINNLNVLNLTQFDSNLNTVWSINYTTPSVFAASGDQILAATDQSVLLWEYKLPSPGQVQYDYAIVGKNGQESSFNLTQLFTLPFFLKPLGIGLDYFIAHETINSSNQLNPYSISGFKFSTNGSVSHLFTQNLNSLSYDSPFYRNKNIIEIPIYAQSAKHYLPNPHAPYSATYYVFNNFTQLQYNIQNNSTDLIQSDVASKYNQIENVYYNDYSLNDYNMSLYMFPYNDNYLIIEFDNYSNKTVISISSAVENITEYSTNEIIYPNINMLEYIYSNGIIYPGYQINDKYYFNVGVYNNQTKSTTNQLLMFSGSHKIINLETFSNPTSSAYSLGSSFTTKFGNGILYYGIIDYISSELPAYYFIKLYHLQDNSLNFIVYMPLPFKILIGAIFVLPIAFYLIRRAFPKVTNSELYPVEK